LLEIVGQFPLQFDQRGFGFLVVAGDRARRNLCLLGELFNSSMVE
jgi:hypothetical protein